MMKTSLHFLIAAKQSEFLELQGLARTATLVDSIARLVHALQRERGLSNLYLGSGGERSVDERAAQLRASAGLEDALRAHFDSLDTQVADGGHGGRLFLRVAYALQGLDSLPTLRSLVSRGGNTPQQASAAYTRLINALLAVVFEAADTAGDAEVSRLLVSLFNFMQGKESAGQERATGAALFASGRATRAEQQRLQFLIESQEQSLDVFCGFAGEHVLDAWRGCCPPEIQAELERMRRILCVTDDGGALNAEFSARWFEVCSTRLDAMKRIEEGLTEALRALCASKREDLQHELQSLHELQQRLGAEAQAVDVTTWMAAADGLAPEIPVAWSQPLGIQLERSVLDLVQSQARRLQLMTGELDAARASLNDRKLVERAKGLLMATRHVTEDEAHKVLRQLAMDRGRRIPEAAEWVLRRGGIPV